MFFSTTLKVCHHPSFFPYRRNVFLPIHCLHEWADFFSMLNNPSSPLFLFLPPFSISVSFYWFLPPLLSPSLCLSIFMDVSLSFSFCGSQFVSLQPLPDLSLFFCQCPFRFCSVVFSKVNRDPTKRISSLEKLEFSPALAPKEMHLKGA